MRIIRARPPLSALDVSLSGIGSQLFSDTFTSTASGSGLHVNINRRYWFWHEWNAATVANSSATIRWDREGGTSFSWWDDTPLAWSWVNRLIRLNSDRSAIALTLGAVQSFNGSLDYNQWRLDTSAKRVGLVIERNNLGNIGYNLAWSNGVTASVVLMAAIPDNAVCTLLWNPYAAGGRKLAFYVNGGLWAASAAADLPTGVYSDNRFVGWGLLKKLADSNLMSLRMFMPTLFRAHAL